MIFNGMNISDSRVIVLSGDINSESAAEILQRLHDINTEDEEAALVRRDFEPVPIILVINSGGGSVYDGFAIIGAIESSVTPVITVCMGHAMSMALAILVAGHVRYTHRLSVLMYHEVSNGVVGNIQDHKKNLKHMSKLQDMYDKFIIENTSLTQEKLTEICANNDEWYFTADEALEMKIVDVIITAKEKEDSAKDEVPVQN